MKFAHLADCHVGSWRDPKLRELTSTAFSYAIETSIKERVDFVLIAGDLFHTAIPPLDGVKVVFKELAKLRAANIPVYFITGSHDYSPTGKTMLDIIEEAGLGINVFRGEVHEGVLRLKWTIDSKTGVKLTGILGRANQLDSEIYDVLDHTALEKETGEKIFLFHTSLEELTPSTMVIDRKPLSLLPKGCKYYAGGHVHTRQDAVLEGRHIVYPGPLFPASFSELEELGAGGFCIVDNWQVKRVMVPTKQVITFARDVTGVAPVQVPGVILDGLGEVNDAVVLVRLTGVLAGKPSDISWRELADELTRRGAYALLRNTAELTSPELERSMVSIGTLDEIEDRVISEHKVDPAFVKSLMHALSQEQSDGEKRLSYEERISQHAKTIVQSWNGSQR